MTEPHPHQTEPPRLRNAPPGARRRSAAPVALVLAAVTFGVVLLLLTPVIGGQPGTRAAVLEVQLDARVEEVQSMVQARDEELIVVLVRGADAAPEVPATTGTSTTTVASTTTQSTTESTPESTPAPGLLPTLREGDRDPAVGQLKELLTALDYAVPTNDQTLFDPQTAQAVRLFQASADLDPVDGVVGFGTWSKLEEMVALRSPATTTTATTGRQPSPTTTPPSTEVSQYPSDLRDLLTLSSTKQVVLVSADQSARFIESLDDWNVTSSDGDVIHLSERRPSLAVALLAWTAASIVLLGTLSVSRVRLAPTRDADIQTPTETSDPPGNTKPPQFPDAPAEASTLRPHTSPHRPPPPPKPILPGEPTRGAWPRTRGAPREEPTVVLLPEAGDFPRLPEVLDAATLIAPIGYARYGRLLVPVMLDSGEGDSPGPIDPGSRVLIRPPRGAADQVGEQRHE